MPETLEIIFDSADRFPGKISFDVSIRDHRYVDHRDAGTAERSKIAADIHATAVRNGFDFIPSVADRDGERIPIKRFISAYDYAAADPRPIVDAFRDQGYDVAVRGYYLAGRILPRETFESLDWNDHQRGQREEAAYAAGRAAERAGRDAAAILRLQAAALAEEAPDTMQILQAEKDRIRAMQADLREQEIGHQVSEERQDRAFAA